MRGEVERLERCRDMQDTVEEYLKARCQDAVILLRKGLEDLPVLRSTLCQFGGGGLADWFGRADGAVSVSESLEVWEVVVSALRWKRDGTRKHGYGEMVVCGDGCAMAGAVESLVCGMGLQQHLGPVVLDCVGLAYVTGLPAWPSASKVCVICLCCNLFCFHLCHPQLHLFCGYRHTVAVTDAGQLVLANHSPADRPIDDSDAPTGTVGQALSLSASCRVCALLQASGLTVWGYTGTVPWNDMFHPSVGSFKPPSVDNPTAVSIGSCHGVLVSEDGSVHAWGDNSCKQLEVPEEVVAEGVVSAVCGGYHTLAILKPSRRVVGWGGRDDGVMMVGWGGRGESDIDQGQSLCPPHTLAAVMVAAGARHSLALLCDGKVMAWGSNGSKQCDIPVAVQAVRVVMVACGSGHCLALDDTGRVHCWGWNEYGQCDVPADLPPAVLVDGGVGFSAAVLRDGQVRWWGDFGRSAEFSLSAARVLTQRSVDI